MDMAEEDDMREEYDFSGGVRGKYAERFAQGSNVVVLDPGRSTDPAMNTSGSQHGAPVRSGILLVITGVTLLLSACTSSTRNAKSSGSPVPTPLRRGTSTAEDLTGIPACRSGDVRIAAAALNPGVTGGGDSVDITLVPQADCWLTAPPLVMVVDARGRMISAGVIELTRSRILRKAGSNALGEWRSVCTEAAFPLRLRVLIENYLIDVGAQSEGLPVCFVNGAPSDRKAPPPSGFLNLTLD
jgi:hypothetical protein